MKQLIALISLFLIYPFTGQAQISFHDSFDANNNGWTEVILNSGETLVTDGVLRIKSNSKDTLTSHTFLDFDPNKNFVFSCTSTVKKINDKSKFGIIVDYIDDGNYTSFLVWEGVAIMTRVQQGKVVGSIKNGIKLKKEKKAEVNLKLTRNFKGLYFEVNDMLAIEARYIDIKSSGVGLCVIGEQLVEFDDLKIEQ
ncbi:hypothetical protein [Sphingobacterium wenxiniae]|uniref:3-keto-disaccharide hydrolase domain-containing protein n=1 Tax=Sphingobacterium wenxiniae TaxID=683125 RepID=A0A1I6P9X3_9SPHI|nr:hypothetical protein [Sphingobacterium wenxiniae]SFS36971.1 hypothetical protein SAMN05660206_101354 [Sphingobacterium wenxiniae]